MVKTTVGLTLTKFQLNAHFNLIFYFLVDNLAPLPHLAHGSALAGMSDPSLPQLDQWQSHFPMHSSRKM